MYKGWIICVYSIESSEIAEIRCVIGVLSWRFQLQRGAVGEQEETKGYEVMACMAHCQASAYLKYE